MNDNRDLDRRMMMAVVLSLGLYYLYVAFLAPPVPPPVVPTDGVVDAVPAVVDAAPTEPAAQPTPEVDRTIPERIVEMDQPNWVGKLASNDGAMSGLHLQSFHDPIEVTTWWRWIINRVSGESDGGWQPYTGGEGQIQVVGENGSLVLAGAGAPDVDGAYRVAQTGDTVKMSRSRSDGLMVRKTYSPSTDPNVLHIEVEFENTSAAAISDLWVGVAEQMDDSVGRFTNGRQPVAFGDGDLEKVDDPEKVDKADPIDTPSWFGIADRYFLTALMPQGETTGRATFSSLSDGRIGVFYTDPTPLDAGAKRTLVFDTYLGPKSFDLITAYDVGLDDSVEFGIFGAFSKILLLALKMFQKGVTNWGVAIIFLTVLVKLIFFPLTQKSFKSSQAMKEIQPQLAAVKEKYKDDREVQTRETMRLFQENKVNPMGGCLPMVVQMPVWFALYAVLWQSVELYNSSFLYLQDLTLADPFGILPTVVGALMFLQQRITPMPEMDDPAQKFMIKFMPLMFTIFLYGLPSGLNVYICVNSSLSIAQMWLIRRSFNTEPVAA